MQGLLRAVVLPREDYRGFLSYSHADGQAARWLHRSLEGYRLPHALAMTGSGGNRVDRLGPIFRDRDDFPAAVDLSEAVRKALARSHALIVLCSPDTKASPWVAREIDLFRSLFPDRPVLAVLLRGEPEEAFPAALLEGGEPLAADLRPGKDGKRLGLLKIVAGLLDLPLDALVQRDAQRNVRRVTAVTLASFALLLVMAIMTVTAINARNEAVRQRAEAEGLIEYMLTDLRANLRRVGRLDVMTGVNARAMRYYLAQGDLRSLPGDSLDRRARILHAMGEDDETQGNAGQARALFTEAYKTTQEQLKRAPGNQERLFAHAQSAYWLGYIGYRAADWRAATRYWREYRRLAGALMTVAGEDRRSLQEAGYAEGNLCTLALARAETAKAARPHCQAALSFMQRVARSSPDDIRIRSDLANRRAWLADALFEQGDAVNGLAQRRAEERELRALAAAHPNNMALLDQWMRALMTMSENLRDQGRRDEAHPFHQQAQRIAARLTAYDPTNKTWRRWAKRIENF